MEETLLVTLAEDVISLNLQAGISNSLGTKLDLVAQAFTDVVEQNDVAAENALYAFINAVEAQRGGKLTDDEANALIAGAQAILDALAD